MRSREDAEWEVPALGMVATDAEETAFRKRDLDWSRLCLLAASIWLFLPDLLVTSALGEPRDVDVVPDPSEGLPRRSCVLVRPVLCTYDISESSKSFHRESFNAEGGFLRGGGFGLILGARRWGRRSLGTSIRF